jgi:dodecin
MSRHDEGQEFGEEKRVGSIGVACRWNGSLDAGNFEMPFVGDLKSVDGRFDMAKRQVAVAAKKQAAAAVYKIVEVVGVSESSWEDAGRSAVEIAASSLRDLRVAEVTKMDMKVENGKVTAFRTRVSLSFKYEA